MKARTLLMVAILAPGLLCSAQNPAPAPAASALLAASASDTYVIGGNDSLTITVWQQPTLSGTILVRPDGKISMPLIGDVQAAGLTPLRLADQITAKLTKYIQAPNVSVVVAQIHSKIVYMIGEVTKPGPVEMTPDMTLLEAVSSAGGLTEFANKKKMYILRDENGKRQRIPVHYKEALAGKSGFDLPLQPDDTIVVP